MANAMPQQVIPKMLPKFFHSWVGCGTIFNFLVPYERYPVIRFINTAYDSAPLFKWSLSIVPLMGIYYGTPSVDKIDVKSSSALALTGIIWTIYAFIIQPQNLGSLSFAMVNACVFFVNGYNCYRYWAHRRAAAAIAESPIS